MLEVELAALDGWSALGVVPADAVERIRAVARPPSPERVAELERETNHDVAAFVDAVAETLGADGRWFHFGLTSSDVLDTALSLVRAGGGGARARRARPGVPRRRRPRGGASRDALHGAHARCPCGADDVRPQARRLGVRARARPGTARARARGPAGRQAVGGGRPVRGHRPGGRADRVRAARARAGAELDADPPARPPRRAAHVARGHRVVARPVRDGDPPSRAHGGAGGRGAVRARPEGLVCDAAQAQPDHRRADLRAWRASCAANALVGLENVALWHERDISHSSAERIVLPDSFLAVDYMLDRFAWLVEGLVVRPERMRANVDASHGLFFSQRLLLALVESGLVTGRRVPAGAAARDARVGRGARLPRARPRETPRSRAASTSTACSRSSAYTAHVDTVFDRLRALVAEREAAVHA